MEIKAPFRQGSRFSRLPLMRFSAVAWMAAVAVVFEERLTSMQLAIIATIAFGVLVAGEYLIVWRREAALLREIRARLTSLFVCLSTQHQALLSLAKTLARNGPPRVGDGRGFLPTLIGYPNLPETVIQKANDADMPTGELCAVREGIERLNAWIERYNTGGHDHVRPDTFATDARLQLQIARMAIASACVAAGLTTEDMRRALDEYDRRYQESSDDLADAFK